MNKLNPINLFRIARGSTNSMIFFLSFSNIFGNGLTIISGLFVAKWMIPEELGAFNVFSIITGYIVLIQLGIPSGLSRELPFYIGRNEKGTAINYASVAQYWQKGLGLVLLSATILIAFVFLSQKNYQTAAGITVVGITTWHTLYVTKYLKILYRSNRDFNKLSWIKIINSLFLFFSIVLVWLYGFYGLCIRAILAALVDFIFTYKWRPITTKPKWNRLHFIDLFRLGLPMFAIANIFNLWPIIQKTLIVTLGGTKALGLFVIAIMVENSMKTVTKSISGVMYPTMSISWGKGATVGEMVKLVMKPLIIGLILFCLLAPLAWWLLPIFIESILPNYIEGIQAARWMIIVGILGLANVFSNYYNVVKDQLNRLKLYLGGIITWAITVLILFQKDGFSLVIFPQAMVLAMLVMIIINYYHIKKNWSSIAPSNG